MPAPPPYRVRDRSLFLPYYKRLLIDPVLPKIPARIPPNAITHVGHLCCLAALLVLGAGGGAWRLVACILLLHAYVWCDNVDGGHARRTGQTSAGGEYLDHGLDLLNTTYTSFIVAYALASEDRTLGLVILGLACALSAVTIWEQAMTGVYQLGYFNQIELVATLSALLVFDAVFGRELHARIVALGLDLRSWITLFPALTVSVGLLRAVGRVHAAGRSVVPGLGVMALLGAVLWAHASGHVATSIAFGATATSLLAFGLYALRCRARGDQRLGVVATYVPAAAAAAIVLVARVPVASPTHLVFGLGLAGVALSLDAAIAVARNVTSADG